MPPKKGKKGKKGGKNGKGKKATKIVLTPKEEILQYQISLKQDVLGKVMFECEKVKTDNSKINEKLHRYKIDREKFSDEMIRKYREFLKSRQSDPYKSVRDKTDVISAMKSNWKRERIENIEVEKLETEIKSKDDEIKMLNGKIRQLEHLRDEEINNNDLQIKQLSQFLGDMERNFDAICNYTQKNYNNMKADVALSEEVSVEQLQNNACAKASGKVSDDAKHELSDNEWLINKSKFHEVNLERLKNEVEQLQSENIELNETIVELNQNNQQFESFYLTEIEPEDILYKEGILEYNFNEIFSKQIIKTNMEKSSPRNQESTFESFKDYLNFNLLDLSDLSLTGKSLEIKDAPSLTEEEEMEEMFTVKNLPLSFTYFKNL